MRISYFPIVQFVVLAVSLSSCVSPNTFQKDALIYGAESGGLYRKILRTNCYKCHSPDQTSPDLTVDDSTLVMNGLVFAGDPDHSPLILKVQGLSGTIMPKAPYPPLSNDEIAILKTWISGL